MTSINTFDKKPYYPLPLGVKFPSASIHVPLTKEPNRSTVFPIGTPTSRKPDSLTRTFPTSKPISKSAVSFPSKKNNNGPLEAMPRTKTPKLPKIPPTSAELIIEYDRLANDFSPEAFLRRRKLHNQIIGARRREKNNRVTLPTQTIVKDTPEGYGPPEDRTNP